MLSFQALGDKQLNVHIVGRMLSVSKPLDDRNNGKEDLRRKTKANSTSAGIPNMQEGITAKETFRWQNR
jgi:hypothetical protein